MKRSKLVAYSMFGLEDSKGSLSQTLETDLGPCEHGWKWLLRVCSRRRRCFACEDIPLVLCSSGFSNRGARTSSSKAQGLGKESFLLKSEGKLLKWGVSDQKGKSHPECRSISPRLQSSTSHAQGHNMGQSVADVLWQWLRGTLHLGIFFKSLFFPLPFPFSPFPFFLTSMCVHYCFIV